jgi:hypothetical protein
VKLRIVGYAQALGVENTVSLICASGKVTVAILQ